MGMYSTFSYEEIEVTDSEGLFDFLMELKNKDEGDDYMWRTFLENIIDGKTYSFEDWDNLKLISYWYPHQVDFLDKISNFIEGYVEFDFETPEERARIEFKNGETIFMLGYMSYKSLTAKELKR